MSERSCFKKTVSSSTLLLHKVTNELHNLIRSRVEREEASIEDVDFGFQHIVAVTFRFSEIEREVDLTLNHEQTWLSLLHPCHLQGRGTSRRRIVGASLGPPLDKK